MRLGVAPLDLHAYDFGDDGEHVLVLHVNNRLVGIYRRNQPRDDRRQGSRIGR
jgi:hypothetical protein